MKPGPEPETNTFERDLVALYDEALPHVYGYLLSRCGNVSTAEDLTSETFLVAADAVHRTPMTPLTAPLTKPLSQAWLFGVARHKLADHWRRQARESSRIRALLDNRPGERRSLGRGAGSGCGLAGLDQAHPPKTVAR